MSKIAKRIAADKAANGYKPSSMEAQACAPLNPTHLDDEQCWRVWADRPSYDEDPKRWKCVAIFMFLPDCLDFIAACQDGNTEVVYQSPRGVQLVRPTDHRVVYKPNGGARCACPSTERP